MDRPFLAIGLCCTQLLLSGCQIESEGFQCQNDLQCESAGRQGVCERNSSACSFPDSSCSDLGRRYGEFAPEPYRDQCVIRSHFEEDFRWQGLHASTLAAGSTVWWSPADWDARSRTSYLAYSQGGFSIDIHRTNSDLKSIGLADDLLRIGGDGTPGVGIMHVEDFGTLSARLRNPGLVRAGEALVIDFQSNAVNSIGDFWEIVLTPAGRVDGAEFASHAAWSIDHPVDSLTVAMPGFTAYPCNYGWAQTPILLKTVSGQVTKLEGSSHTVDPTKLDSLAHYQIRFLPDHVEIWADMSGGDDLSLLQTFPTEVPWEEVHVHLVAMANLASSYPDDSACGDYYTSKAREIAWKKVKVSPVLYGRTAVFPSQIGTDRVPLRTGWLGHDVRDIRHIGSVDGVSQPNLGQYDPDRSYAICTDASSGECQNSTPLKTLSLALREEDLSRAALVRFLYDVRGESSGQLIVNGASAVELPNRAVTGLEPVEWEHRSVEFPVSLLHAGDNTVGVGSAGRAQFARMEIEISYLP